MNPSLLVSDKPLRVKVEKIDDSAIELSFSDHQKITISPKNLPHQTKVGDYLYLNLLTKEELEMTKKEIAKTILEDILSN